MNKDTFNHYSDVSMKNLEMYNEIINNAYRSMNNIIFLISTGAFVLTISFIGYLNTEIYSTFLLLISWIFLFLSIIFNFSAHWITARTSTRHKELINEARINGFPDGGNFNIKSENDKIIKKYVKWAKIINTCVLFFLPLGIVSLICFSWINLNTQNKNTSSNLISD